jgi:hypothetical protein
MAVIKGKDGVDKEFNRTIGVFTKIDEALDNKHKKDIIFNLM